MYRDHDLWSNNGRFVRYCSCVLYFPYTTSNTAGRIIIKIMIQSPAKGHQNGDFQTNIYAHTLSLPQCIILNNNLLVTKLNDIVCSYS